MRVRVCLDEEQFTSKQECNDNVNYVTARIGSRARTLRIQSLAKAISQGHTWTPSTFSYYEPKGRPYRNINAFEQMQLVAVDVDSGDLQLDDILERCVDNCVDPCIVHESFSSCEDLRKWRIIFCADEPIVDVDLAYHAIGALAHLFGGDPACIEPARLLYGTTKAKLHVVKPDYTVPVQYLKTLHAARTKRKTLYTGNAEERSNRPFASTLTASERAILILVAKDASLLIADPHADGGSRYKSLWDAARKLAQLAYVPEYKIQTLLEKEVSKYEETWSDWDKSVPETIAAGISWGRQHVRAF